MKAAVVLVLVFCYVQAGRKVAVPFDKNANLAFINMEGGGVRPGGPAPAKPTPTIAPVPAPTPAKPLSPTVAKPAPTVAPQPKPIAPTPAKPLPSPAKPAQSPTQIKPVPVNPSPATRPNSTPGPGSVQQLINYYDSQGKASVIRPYSYSTAVKQG